MMKSLLQRTARRGWKYLHNVSSSGRLLTSSSLHPTKITITSPAEAGKRAQDLARDSQRKSTASSPSSSSLSSFDNMSTMLAHAGVAQDGQNNIPLAPSLEFATTYTRPAEGPYQDGDSVYARADNPTRLLLEQTVSQLECHHISSHRADDDEEGVSNSSSTTEPTAATTTTCAFASGMMAASSVVLAHALPITVLLPQDLYHGVSTVLADVFQERFGVHVRHVNMVGNTHDNDSHDDSHPIDTTTTEESALEQELRHALASTPHQASSGSGGGGSIIVWMESPSNPSCHVLDLASICDMVDRIRTEQQQQHSSSTSSASSAASTATTITTVVDSTLAPPVIQQPLQFGVDVVMHSGTKYFGGHSDVLLGVTTASPFTVQGRRLAPLIRQVQECVGGVASPMDSWLTLRGLRTLHVRVERQCRTALAIAEHLSTRRNDPSSLVTAVHYPGLTSHPNHSLAKRQMKNGCFGGVLSVELKSEHMAMAFAGALHTIHRATSLGGTETLIEHRASIEPPNRVTSPPGLLRITVGLEDASDLIRDIDRALLIAQEVEQELL